jgi:hypothetical protein
MAGEEPKKVTVDHDGRTYLWTGASWVDLKSFMIPAVALEPRLGELAAAAYGEHWRQIAPPPRPKATPGRRAGKSKVPPPAPSGVEVTAEYQAVLALLAAGTPVVLATGVAGTGKSTLIQVVREQAGKRAVVVAPTGIAALNAGGATIHSFFRFPPRFVNAADIEEADERAIYEKLDLLIVDEVSMVRADVLDGIDKSLRVNRRVPRFPFGGVQVLLVGDLFQLPPVVSKDEKEIFRGGRYESPHFFSARILREVSPAAVELTKVFRQQEDGFVELLNAVRSGEDPAGTVARINAACLREPWEDGNHLTLTSTNDVADATNAARLAALPGAARVYRGQVEGRMEREGEKLPAPLELTLKEGARVMFTRNDEERRWVNGTLGIVRGLDANAVHVEVGPGGGGATHAVGPAVWESHRYRYDRPTDRIEAEVVGSYRQIPLMPAWAVTIHKSQGKTLERVIVDVGRGAFAPGQVYVALSRCRRLEDVVLAKALRPQDIKVDPQIRSFHGKLWKGARRSS